MNSINSRLKEAIEMLLLIPTFIFLGGLSAIILGKLLSGA